MHEIFDFSKQFRPGKLFAQELDVGRVVLKTGHFEGFRNELLVATALDAILIDLDWCPRLLSMLFHTLLVDPIQSCTLPVQFILVQQLCIDRRCLQYDVLSDHQLPSSDTQRPNQMVANVNFPLELADDLVVVLLLSFMKSDHLLNKRSVVLLSR